MCSFSLQQHVSNQDGDGRRKGTNSTALILIWRKALLHVPTIYIFTFLCRTLQDNDLPPLNYPEASSWTTFQSYLTNFKDLLRFCSKTYSTCLVPRPLYSARPTRFGFCEFVFPLFASATSSRRIGRERLRRWPNSIRGTAGKGGREKFVIRQMTVANTQGDSLQVYFVI